MEGSSIMRRPPFGNNPLVGERGTDTQRKILGAALDVFAEVGFSEARVELITKRAGCSRPAFYQYFSSKDDVFWQLAGQLGHDMVVLGHQLGTITPDTEGVAALACWIDEFTALYEAYAPVFAAFQAASRDHQPLAEGSSTISDRLGDDLRGAFEAPRGAHDASLAPTVVAVLIRCSFYWHSLGETVDRERLTVGLAQLVHRLFAGAIDGVNTHRQGGAGQRRLAPPVPPAPPADGERPLRPRGEQTRQRLLDAGAAVLPSRGYHDARVDDIVAEAGVSHGKLYRYFENKDEFFRVLAEEASTRMVELLDAFPAAADAGLLREWMEEWFDTYESNGGVISTWQEMHSADPGLVSFGQEVAATVVSRLVTMLEQRGFGDALVDALALLALVERGPYSVYTLRFRKRADAIDAMVTIVRRGLMGHAA